MSVDTRESWLNAAAILLRPHFEAAGFPVPTNVRMTCGFPSRSALARKAQRIGECWSAESSGDKHFEVFISPVLDDAMNVLGVLTHELVHAAVGLKAKHKGKFVTCARALHLEGAPKSCGAGEAFKQHIGDAVLKALPPYPHKRLIASANEKKQTTRMLKCACPECGYTVRLAGKWLEMGAPICPLDEVSMVAE